MIKDVKNMSIKNVFGTSEASNKHFIYTIPAYQREYSWNKTNWENLFDDLYQSEGNYFLGAIICITTENEFIFNDVIDGQQRLTTLSILLFTLYNHLDKFKKTYNNDDDEFEKILKHTWDLRESLYLKDEEKLRLTLSIQKYNQKDYEYLIKKEGFNKPGLVEPDQFDNRKIALAYKYFSERFKQICMNFNTTEKQDFYIKFLNKVNSASVIKIDVDDASSAFTLFESINNRGIPLNPIDLIKNELIKECDKQDILDASETNQSWQNIVKNIPDPKSQVRFLKHFYYAFSHEIKSEFPNLSVNHITETSLVKIYQDMINKKPRFILDELTNCAHIYGFILGKREIVNINITEKDKLSQQLLDLNKLQFVPSNSLLLYLFKCYPKENYVPLLDFLGVWFLCRHLTDIPSAKKLDSIFSECIDLINKEKKYSLEIIKCKLREYIDKEAVKSFFKNEDFYKGNNERVQYLLMRLETSRRFKENAIDKTQNWTIEHIFPRKPATNSDWNEYFKTDEDKSYLNRLGNLTLTCFNSNLSNKSFKDKYFAKDKDTGQQIGYASGNVKINQSLIGKNNWTVSDIKERTEELANEFLELLDS